MTVGPSEPFWDQECDILYEDTLAISSSLAKEPFWVVAFLRRFCQIASGFHFFGFHDSNFFFFYRARSSALLPTPNLEDQVPVFMFPSDRMAQFGFPFHRPLRLAGLRWRYSNLLSHGNVRRMGIHASCVWNIVYKNSQDLEVRTWSKLYEFCPKLIESIFMPHFLRYVYIGGEFPLPTWNFAASTRVPILPTRQMRRCEISSGKSSSILRIAPTLLRATSICSVLLNIIFRLNIFPTMKL
jgi:hypothetical protein